MSSCRPKTSTPVRSQSAVSSGRQEQWKKQAKHLLIFIWRWLIVRKLSMIAELSYWSVYSCGLWKRPFCPGCQSAVISNYSLLEIRGRSRKRFMLGNSTRLKSSLDDLKKSGEKRCCLKIYYWYVLKYMGHQNQIKTNHDFPWYSEFTFSWLTLNILAMDSF